MLPKRIRSDMTVFHAAETAHDVNWTSFIVRNVFWRNDYGRTLADKGIKTNDRVSVVALKESLPDGFVISKDDKIVNCIVDGDMPTDCFTVVEIADNNFGSVPMRHLRIFGR